MRKTLVNSFLGIDGSRCCEKEPTGVELYSDAITQGLLQKARDARKSVMIYTRGNVSCLRLCGALEKRIRLPFLWTQLGLSLHMVRHAPEALFVPSHVLPFVHAKRSVVTIHDVAFVPCKHVYSFLQRAYLMWTTRFACRYAAAIIVPSEATKKDLIEYFHCAQEKVHVIPHGFTQPKKSSLDDATVLNRIGILPDQRYILFIGRLEAKKNLVRLLQAFSIFKKTHPGFKLVLAGKPGVGYGEISRAFRALLLKEDVLLPGYISLDEKDILFRHAAIFTLPSRYEGFGFPILDAFYYGVPVVTSKFSSLPEVGGDAVYSVNVESADKLAAAFSKLAGDETFRNELVRRGKERLKQFSWEKSVDSTWELLEEVAI